MNVRRAADLRSAKVVVCSTTATSIACATNLCLANIGQLVLLEAETPENSDPDSFFSSRSKDPGKPRAAHIKDMLSQLNSGTAITSVGETLNAHNIESLISVADVVAESCRDGQAKLLLSDSCMRLHKPLVHTDLLDYSMQLFTMLPGRSACLRCLFALTGQEDHAAGQALPAAFLSLATLAGSLQAAEVIKLITGRGSLFDTKLLSFDILRGEFDYRTGLTAHPDCPDCGGTNR